MKIETPNYPKNRFLSKSKTLFEKIAVFERFSNKLIKKWKNEKCNYSNFAKHQVLKKHFINVKIPDFAKCNDTYWSNKQWKKDKSEKKIKFWKKESYQWIPRPPTRKLQYNVLHPGISTLESEAEKQQNILLQYSFP